jgi:hypothetical protein
MVIHCRYIGRASTGMADQRTGKRVVKRNGITSGRCPLSGYKGMNLKEAHDVTIPEWLLMYY